MLTNNLTILARFYFANELYAEPALNNGEPLEYVEVYCNKAIKPMTYSWKWLTTKTKLMLPHIRLQSTSSRIAFWGW